MAKFAIAKQRHQDGITGNRVIITSCVHYFGMDFDLTQLTSGRDLSSVMFTLECEIDSHIGNFSTQFR